MTKRALAGAILWSGLAVTAAFGLVGLGTIELLFLLGPLLVVPLGLRLTSQLLREEVGNLHVTLANWIQLPAAICVIAAFFFQPGITATILTLPWFCFGCLLGFWGLLRLARGGGKNLEPLGVCISAIYLPVGCAWLLASRMGLTPMNFQEPIVLLTVVHFHFAGFAAPLLAAATASEFARAPRIIRRILTVVAGGVFAGPGMLAAGFVLGPRVKLVAALLIAISEIGLAFFFLAVLRSTRSHLAQVFLCLSASSVVVAMAFAAVWALGEFPLQPFVHLAEMAKFHGTSNAIGFTVCGLLGWTLALSPAPLP